MSPILTSYVVPIVHVLACVFLVVVVLLQKGKGADMGAVFGGGSQTLFGSSGAGNLLTKVTAGVAATFMITSLILAVGARNEPRSELLGRIPVADAPAPFAVPAPDGAEPAATPETTTAAAPTDPAGGEPDAEPDATAPEPPATATADGEAATNAAPDVPKPTE